MPKHEIALTLPKKPLKNVDTTIEIWSDWEKPGESRKLGELRISRGTLDWVPGGAQKPRRVAWEDLATMLENPARTLRALAKFRKEA